jgi:hypothetical protein
VRKPAPAVSLNKRLVAALQAGVAAGRRASTPTVSMMLAPQLVGQFTDVVFDVAAGEGN